jgi:hypothetical protein
MLFWISGVCEPEGFDLSAVNLTSTQSSKTCLARIQN